MATQTAGNRCDEHNRQLADGERCRQCAEAQRAHAIAVTAISGFTPAESAELDAEMLKDIESDIGFAKFLHRIARDRIDDGNPNDWNAAAKLIAEGTKLKYQAIEQKQKISGRAHSRYLVEHEKDIKGLRRKGN